ncbi:MAG: polymerase, sigma-24 subunit, subfamily [Verrucomicrobiales bacterium]|nr:polymerase, sigma-24 subunit, subfamily [Verrucomicrobiales bacterium]
MPHAASLSTAVLGELLLQNSVQAAPAGLVPLLAAVSLKEMAVASYSLSHGTTIMATLKTKIVLLSLAGMIGTVLVFKHIVDNEKRDYNAKISDQTRDLAELKNRNQNLEQTLATMQGEISRHQKDHTELLALRDKAGRSNSLTHGDREDEKMPNEGQTEWIGDGQSTPGKITATVRNQQTLVTEGWESQPGKRVLVFVTAEVDKQNVSDPLSWRVILQNKMIEMPVEVIEQMFSTFGFNLNSRPLVLTNPQTAILMRALEQQTNVNVLYSPRILTVNGRQSEMQIGEGPKLTILPTVSTDGEFITMNVSTEAPTTPKVIR